LKRVEVRVSEAVPVDRVSFYAYDDRGADIDTTSFDDLAASAQTTLGATSFSSFQSQLNGVHGAVHVRVGGDMSSVPTAGYDPIFYLHHANIDRLWAQWQQANPGALPATEASLQLQPFNRPFSTDWQLGSEMASTDALGYRYRTFCFVLPPSRLWEVITLKWPLEHELDITQALRDRDDEELTLKLLAVDANGEDVPAEELNLTGVELLAE
jgi:hypothetical protein